MCFSYFYIQVCCNYAASLRVRPEISAKLLRVKRLIEPVEYIFAGQLIESSDKIGTGMQRQL
jgi:hypothetical protein